MKICTKCQKRFPFHARLCDTDGEPLEVEDPPVDIVVGGRYRLEKMLGKGGMGVVYLATHQALGKTLALKFLRGNMADDPVVLKRFQREAKSASAIDHPGIIDVTDFGEDPDWGVFFTMEFVSGGSLSDLLKERGSLSPAEVVHIAAETAEGLAVAHEAGIIHRDLKPDNIMLARRPGKPPQPKIMDFGIAGMLDQAGPRLTMTGSVFGTPHYMSPEQAMGQHVDHRSDVYALGVIIYEMAAGSRPFNAPDMLSMLELHRTQPPESPRVRNQGIPPGLERVILHCLAKDPADRFQSMNELAQALRSGGELGGETIMPGMSAPSFPGIAPTPTQGGGVSPYGTSPPGCRPTTTQLGRGEVAQDPDAPPPARRGPGLRIAIAAALAVAAAGGGWFLFGPGRPGAAGEAPTVGASAPAGPPLAAPPAPAAAPPAAAVAPAAPAPAEPAAPALGQVPAAADPEAAAKAAAPAPPAPTAADRADVAPPKEVKAKKPKKAKKKRGRSLLGLD